ncbi:hypothetical protein [Lactococcus formosensis]|uniref:hypothetical protein n=1 Tax=Lactococcus formosensis TaxID=1281486 RepID=UPI00254E4AF0|nr:hypothetical protein [Lactococcus formosensis]
MIDPIFLKHEIVFNPTGNEFDEARDQLLGTYKLVKIEDWEYKFIKQSKLSIPKKIAELLDIAIEGLTKFEDFLWAVDEFDVLIPKSKVEYFRNWTNEEPNAHALAVSYVTGKALGVDFLEVVE